MKGVALVCFRLCRNRSKFLCEYAARSCRLDFLTELDVLASPLKTVLQFHHEPKIRPAHCVISFLYSVITVGYGSSACQRPVSVISRTS